MKNILIPCDFSKPSEEAFKFAVSIARQSGGQIHVLYVIDITFLKGNHTISPSYAFNVSFIKDIEKDAEQKFKTLWNRYSPMTLPVKFKHAISSLTQEVTDYIISNNIDLVIMGTHGAGNAALGSNTQKIVRNSPVPVLTVRLEPKKVQDIVLPVYPWHRDEGFIAGVKKLQEFFQARLHLLYVNTPLFFKSDPDAVADLEEFARNTFNNYTINVRADYDVEQGVAHFAKEIQADLVAMGTHAWKGFAHLLVGSIAEDTVNHLDLPTWTCAFR